MQQVHKWATVNYVICALSLTYLGLFQPLSVITQFLLLVGLHFCLQSPLFFQGYTAWSPADPRYSHNNRQLQEHHPDAPGYPWQQHVRDPPQPLDQGGEEAGDVQVQPVLMHLQPILASCESAVEESLPTQGGGLNNVIWFIINFTSQETNIHVLLI